jgi:hypothetical protein
MSWQGSTGRPTEGTTVPRRSERSAESCRQAFAAGRAPSKADVAVVVIGETPYAEMKAIGRSRTDPADVAAVKQARGPECRSSPCCSRAGP